MSDAVHLEVNLSGSWRRVISVDRKWFDDGDLENDAANLLMLACDLKLRARIIEPGKTAPLATWSFADGWRDYVRPGDAPNDRIQPRR